MKLVLLLLTMLGGAACAVVFVADVAGGHWVAALLPFLIAVAAFTVAFCVWTWMEE
jgi:hypothetical protein